jgi:hypothetical protein
MARRRSTELKSLPSAHALRAGFVKTIQINLGGIKAAKLQENFVEIHSATKIRILFFYPSIAGYSPAKENRQSEKPHSTLNSSISCSISSPGHVGRSGFNCASTSVSELKSVEPWHHKIRNHKIEALCVK